MKENIRFFIVLLLFQTACQKSPPKYTTLEGEAQGTTFRMVYQDANEREYATEMDSIFRAIDRSMSLWDSTSIISRVNRGDSSVTLDAPFERVFAAAQRISENTNGAFDVTVAPLVKAWGFSFKKGLPPPTPTQVDSLRQFVGYQKVSLKNHRLLRTNPHVSVDFNAIAQGYTVDAIAKFLENKGIENYLVEVGGEVRAKGTNERHESWKIGIDKPLENGKRAIQAVVPLKNTALATSGSYRKFIERDGKKYSHTINPATGYPVTHTLLSASVLAADATDADAYATACMVEGVDGCLNLARRQGFNVYLIYHSPDGQLNVRKTDGFRVL